MKEFLKEYYGLELESMVQISPRTYLFEADHHKYLLKSHENRDIDEVARRLTLVNIETFALPIKSVEGDYLETKDDVIYAVYPYFEDENLLAKDVKLNFFIQSLAHLHAQTSVIINPHDGFFESSLEYLEDEINRVDDELLSRIERVEREAYHSPADWYFLLNYEHFHQAILEARRHQSALKTEWEGAGAVRLSLTYQNFDYHHILVKQRKIVSLDKMSLAPTIYDLFFLFTESFSSRIDVANYLRQYVLINPLKPFEIEWLLTFLFIPKMIRKEDEIEDIKELRQSLSYLELVEKAVTYLKTLNNPL